MGQRPKREQFQEMSNVVSIPFERRLECTRVLLCRILQQTRRNGEYLAAVKDDLAAIKSCLDRHDQRFDDLERSFDNLGYSLNGMEGESDGLRDDLTKTIRAVMREVLNEHDKNALEWRR
jgi:hypothetical protein